MQNGDFAEEEALKDLVGRLAVSLSHAHSHEYVGAVMLVQSEQEQKASYGTVTLTGSSTTVRNSPTSISMRMPARQHGKQQAHLVPVHRPLYPSVEASVLTATGQRAK
jgi:hypothetical protein